MKIAVFGATGKTGMEIVKQALDLGHEVRAFVRNPEKMKIRNNKLSLVQGDVVNAKDVNNTVEGIDVIISALGPTPETKEMFLARGTENIINSMKKHRVRRLIIESSYPMSGSPEGMEFLRKLGMTDEQISAMKPMIDDKIEQEDAVRNSKLDWIIVRPLMLTNGTKTGQYMVGEKLDVKPGDNISRADVADFMLKLIEDDKWLHKTVTISY